MGSSPPADHAAPRYLAEVSRACLVAGLLPNVAWLRRFGKGETMGGLQVVAHPGSVNSRAADALVVFYGESSCRGPHISMFSPGKGENRVGCKWWRIRARSIHAPPMPSLGFRVRTACWVPDMNRP
jgi:hypothetical protein